MTTTGARRARRRRALGHPDAFALRAARPGDRDDIVDMMLALYREDRGTVRMTRAKAMQTWRTFARDPRRGRALVLVEATRAIGYLLVVPFWSNELGGNVCTVDEMYVAEDRRGSGVATRVIRALATGKLAPFPHIVALELEVTPTNHRARALYRRLGFRARRNATLRRTL